MDAFPFTTGIGYDVHRLEVGLPLWLCGLEIPSEKGLVAHSDGDVALHALCDALLGAAALGDIGKLFPPSDERYRAIRSTKLLLEVLRQVELKGFAVGNVDITIIAERPKIAPHIKAMIETLQPILGDCVQISIKATTNERIGFVGREEGIAALATCLLYRKNRL